TPGLATTVKDAGGTTVDNADPAPLGAKVHDTATLSGGVAGQSFDGTATVTYKFFANNDCTVPADGSEAQAVAANGDVTDSSPSAALGAGSYSYKASYSGNANYAPQRSSCPPRRSSDLTPGLATTVKDAGGTTVDNADPAPLG